MNILVHEYTCGNGHLEEARSLHQEGLAMLQALLEDLSALPNVDPFTLLTPPLTPPPGVTSNAVLPGQEETAFRLLAKTCDQTIVIAPEFHNILADRCRWVTEVGSRLLGPSPDAVQLASDKVALADRLRELGIATPRWGAPVTYPAVLKPRDGAGSQATFLVHDPNELAQALSQCEAGEWNGEMIVQPLVAGAPVSVAFLVGPQQAIPLVPAAQHLSNDGRFRYLGGHLPIEPDLAARAIRLGQRAVEAIDGLLGYIGVDLILGAAEDGSEDQVIEVNPRLTTSYLGLRALAETNLAGGMLDVASGRRITPLVWRTGQVTFQADGTLCRS